jgi:hypothetical protein
MDPEIPDLDPELKDRPLPEGLRLEAQPYRPDNGFTPFGAILVVALSILAAIVLGRLLSLANNQWFYIIVLFPFLAGFLVGKCGTFAIQERKVRNALFSGLVGLGAGALCMAAMHYFDYLRFHEIMEQKPTQKIVAGVRIKAGDKDLGFLDYVDRKADKGVVVRLFNWHANLGNVGSYIYWVCELLLAGAAAMALMASATRRPFCVLCGEWKEKRRLGRLTLAPETAQDILRRGELVRLADGGISRDRGPIALTAWSCPKCREESTVDVKLDESFRNEQGTAQTRQLAFVTFPGAALPILEKLFHAETPAVEEDG